MNDKLLEHFRAQLAYVDNYDSSIVTLIGLLGGLLAGSYVAFMSLSGGDWFPTLLRILLIGVGLFAILTIYALVKAKAGNRIYRSNRFMACQEILSGEVISMRDLMKSLKETRPQGCIVSFRELLKQWWNAVWKGSDERSSGEEGK